MLFIRKNNVIYISRTKNNSSDVIVDIVLKGTTARKQAAGRAGRYIRKGYKITHIDLS